MLGGLCLSDGITFLLGLEHVGWSLSVCISLLGHEYVEWSLFVRQYHSTLDTYVCWVIFVCQTVSLYSWDMSMLGGLCLSDGISLLLGLEYVG